MDEQPDNPAPCSTPQQKSVPALEVPDWKQIRIARLEEAQALLSPAPRDLIIKGLTTALVLVLPAGYSDSDRKLWLAVAYETLKDLPLDLLQRGVRHARLVADHPSKIVPTIMAEVGTSWKWRRQEVDVVAAALNRPILSEHERTLRAAADLAPLSASEIRALDPPLRKMALGQGWLSQAEIDAADVNI